MSTESEVTGWQEVGDRVLVLRYPVLDVNVGLVLGHGASLVVDTLCGPRQGQWLHDAVREVTRDPLAVALTHHHVDHCLGTAELDPVAVWAHEYCAAALSEWPEKILEDAAHELPQLAQEITTARLIVPDQTFSRGHDLVIGGRKILLRHLGRGHTAGDAVVAVPDAGVVLAGDLVEEGAPPAFDESFPLRWPGTLDRLLALHEEVQPYPGHGGLVVPGHGAVVDAAYVKWQRDTLASFGEACKAGFDAGRDPSQVFAEQTVLSPFGADACWTAVHRAYEELGYPVREY